MALQLQKFADSLVITLNILKYRALYIEEHSAFFGDLFPHL